jgi:glycine C-acetyltransferase
MNNGFAGRLNRELDEFRKQGVYKRLNTLLSPQGPWVEMAGRGRVLVLSSNNYLGLCAEPEVIKAGKETLGRLGAGTASVRFICGTFDVHQKLEAKLAAFLGAEAALTYVSCWTANTGLTPTFLSEEDVIISDELNHASVIDGVRATKSGRKVYRHSDMAQLEEHLKSSSGARHRFIFTDGVFSMEGDLARLPDIVELAEKHDAVVAVDDSHGTGVMGPTGRGTAEHFGLTGKVDVITSTLGKALGGAAGGFTAGPAALCDYLTQRSRPQLFSNALPPTVAGSALAAVEYLESHPERVAKLRDNTSYFRERITHAGFKPLAGPTPIVPIIVGETALAIQMSERLLEEKVFVTGFGYPVVPQGHARIRCQISAAHSRDDLDFGIAAMTKAGKALGILKPDS